jgi:UbiA prenyltransferase family.
MFLSTS